MCPPEPDRHRRLVERSGGAGDRQPVRELGALAEGTVERSAGVLATALLGLNPGAIPERWPVADVLVVEAVELGHPVPDVVLVEPVDRPDHAVVPFRAARCLG